MAYITGSREQRGLLLSCIYESIATDDPVRPYDAMVEQMDLAALGIATAPDRVGAPAFDPRAMLKLLGYGYSYGIRSSRQLERATHHNLSFIWLLGGLTPDHKTIARFRRDHRAALANVLKQCAQVWVRLGVIAGNTLFVDGTKIHGRTCIGVRKGMWLRYVGDHQRYKYRAYQAAAQCQRCPQFGHCTTSRSGRRIVRPFTEHIRERLEPRYRQPDAPVFMRRRKLRAARRRREG